jgi:hypothetical protein
MAIIKEVQLCKVFQDFLCQLYFVPVWAPFVLNLACFQVQPFLEWNNNRDHKFFGVINNRTKLEASWSLKRLILIQSNWTFKNWPSTICEGSLTNVDANYCCPSRSEVSTITLYIFNICILNCLMIFFLNK